MKTNFFEQIAGLQSKGSLVLNIQSGEQGLLIVSSLEDAKMHQMYHFSKQLLKVK